TEKENVRSSINQFGLPGHIIIPAIPPVVPAVAPAVDDTKLLVFSYIAEATGAGCYCAGRLNGGVALDPDAETDTGIDQDDIDADVPYADVPEDTPQDSKEYKQRLLAGNSGFSQDMKSGSPIEPIIS